MKTFYLLLSAVCMLICCTQNAQSQKVIYLNDNSTANSIFTMAVGNDANAGDSPSAPFATIAAAMAAASSGDRIMVDAGTYLANTITVKSGVKLIGTPNDLSVLTIQTGAMSLQSDTQLWNLKIQRIIPGTAGGPPTISVATAPGSSNVLIENCLFFKNRTAVYIEPGSTDIVIKRSRFDDNRTGVIFPGSAGATPLSKIYLVDNELTSSRSYGMILTDNAVSPVEVYLSGNNITGNLAGGLENNNTHGSTKIILRNNWFGSNPPAIYTGTTNGGFNVQDHDNPSPNFTNNNSLPGVTYPNQISGTNTAAVQTGFVHASAAVARTATVNFVSSSSTGIVGSPVFNYFPSIQDAIAGSNTDAVITLPNGIFSDNVTVNKKVTIKGTSRNGSIIKGTYDFGIQGAVITITSDGAKLEDLSVTRDYGGSVDVWQAGKRDSGISVGAPNVVLNKITVTDQRSAIYVYNQQGVQITNSLIEKNRTGLSLGVDISNGIITNNIIRNNLTHGIIFNYAFGTGITANNLMLKHNSFSNNWFTDIYAHDPFGSSTTSSYTGADMTCNTFGTNAAETNGAAAGEPGYAAQNPSQFGGTAPAFFASFAGNKINDLTTAPWLVNIPVPAPTENSFTLGNSTLSISPVSGTLTAANNDYRILANAIGCVLPNQTVNLSGTFDWTTTEAKADWANGTNARSGDGIGTLTGSGDNYSIAPPLAVDGVTITSPATNATIKGPGDLASTSLETFLFLNGKAGASYKNWTISNLTIEGFDVSIIADHNGGAVDVNENLTISNNTIKIPADYNAVAEPGDAFQNIGIHYSFGKNISITGNKFFIDGTGVSNDAGSKYAVTNAIQSVTSGGTAYEGLQITNNEFTVSGTPAATNAPVIRGIWENGHNENAAITISGNKFTNADGGNTANLNRQTAFWVTSRSGSGKNVVYQNNEVTGYSEGIAWMGGSYTANTAPDFNTGAIPVQVLNNAFNAVNKGIVIRKSAGSTNIGSPGKINNNSFVGSITTDIANEGSGDATDASCNWYDGDPIVTGSVTYIPKLVNGTDSNPSSTGFQTTAACEFPVKNLTTLETFPTIQGAIDDPQTLDGHEIFIGKGTYNERVSLNKKLTLTGENETTTILDGTGLTGNGSGIKITSGKTNTKIQKLTIQNYAGAGANSDAGIYGAGGNNDLWIEQVTVKNNIAAAGIFAVGPVQNVTVDKVTSENHGPGARGIVIWDGLKKNIKITNSTVTNNNCCGIELQDGTASGVLIKGNTITGMDNSIGLVGLTSGAGPNVIENNTITVNGRFGIEIKNPNGTGSINDTEDGAIIVRNNTVTFGTTADLRDLAGIAVFRRGYVAGYGNVDVPTGVVISGNTVSGFTQPSDSEGFGIVVEGTNHKVLNNTLSGNDVNIQRQAGHTPYTTNTASDGDQSNVADQYFGRGNAPYSCGIEVSGNTPNVSRDIMYLADAGLVVNTNTGETFCSINTAVADAQTDNGHIINVGAGTFDEQVIVNKGVTIKSATPTKPVVTFTGTPTGKLTIFDISADQATIDNLNIKVDLTKLKSAIVASGASIDNISVTNNLIDGYGGAPLAGSYGDRNAVSVNYGGPTNYRVATGGVNSITFTGNTVTGTGTSFFRAGIAADEAAGTFSNNTLQTINHDIIVRFASNGDVMINNNQFNGGGVELPDMNASAGTVSVSNNTFDGTAANPVGVAMLRLKNNFNNRPVSVTGNTFNNHQWGISLENYQNVTLENNMMTPLAGSTTFRHVTVNTKELSSSSGFYAPALSLNMYGNTLNGSGTTGGTGIAFYNHDNDSPTFGTFNIGGTGKENNFASGLGTFIYMDAQTGPTAAPATTMAPWSTNVNAKDNKFDVGGGLLMPTAMSLASLFDVEDRIVHKIDDGVLGFATVKDGFTFVTPQSFTTATLTPKIQRGVEAASPGWTEHVKAGTYSENVQVNKAVKLYGSNYGINPNTGTRVPETMVTTATNDAANGVVFTIAGAINGAEIDGFTIDGDNTSVTGGTAMNGADVNTAEAIAANDGVSNTMVKNNIIKNFNYSGVDIFNDTNGGAATSGNVVSQNKLDNILPTSYGIGVLIYNNAYTSITSNVMTRVRVGVQTGNFSQADPGTSHVIENNTIESSRRGIYHNLAYQNATPFIIKANTINAYPGTTKHDAIAVFSMQNSVGVTLENNIVKGFAGVTNGYNLWSNPSNLVTIKGGTVSDAKVGIFANNFDGYPDAGSNGESSAYVIDGVTIANSATGIFAKDNSSNTNNATVKVTVKGAAQINQPGEKGLLASGKDAQIVAEDVAVTLGGTTTEAAMVSASTGATTPNLIIKSNFTVSRNGNTGATVVDTEQDAIVEIDDAWSIPSGGPTYPFIMNGKLWFENGILNAENGPVLFTNTSSNPLEGSKPEKLTSHILGKAIMASRTVNAGAINFLGANLPAGGDLGSVTIERVTYPGAITPTFASGSIFAKWVITPQNTSVGKNGVTFSFLSNFLGAQTASTLFSYRFNGTAWDKKLAASATVTNDLYTTAPFNITEFSPWTLSSSANALPVTLVVFKATRQENSALLTWTTASESNSDHFGVEHSSDGKKWQTVGNVTAKGESSEMKEYLFVHGTPENGQNLYRLKMVDKDATFSYSRIVQVSFGPEVTLNVYPNPASDRLKISASDWQDVKQVKIYDQLGRCVYTSGSTPTDVISLKYIVQGTYVVKLTRKNDTESSAKIVVNK